MIKRGIVFIFLLSLFPLLFSCSSSNENTSSGGIQHIYEESHEETQVTGINIASNYIELVKEAGVDLHYNISAVVQPENADNKALLYTSSNPEIAEVTQDGNVTIKDFGLFNVKIQSESRQDISQTVDFYVRENILTSLDIAGNPLSFFGAYSITQYGINKEPDTNVGGSLSVNVDRALESAANMQLLFNGLELPLELDIAGLSEVSYEDAGKSIFTYLNGSIKDNDTVVIQLKADSNAALIDNGILQSGDTLYLALKKEYDLVPGQSHVVETPVSVTDIQVSGEQQLDRRINAKYTLNPVVLPVNASNKAVTYSTSDENVLKVSPTGIVTGVNSGSADVYVTSVSNNEVVETVKFNVVDSTKRVKDIVFDAVDTNIYVGTPVTIKASVVPQDATYSDITYYSKDTSIATVNSATGVVTARRKGTVEIAAVSDKGSFEKTITLNVNVYTFPVTAITNVPDEINMAVTNTLELNPEVFPSYADDKSIAYQADESGNVSVDEKGLVTANKAGTAVITVSSLKYPEIKKDITINIRQEQEEIYISSLNINEAPSTLYIDNTEYIMTPAYEPVNANIDTEITVKADNNSLVTVMPLDNGSYSILPVAEGEVNITVKSKNNVSRVVSFNIKKVMNVKGYYTIDKVDYTLGNITETFTPANDNLKGEFAVDLLDDKYSIRGRLQFTPQNPFNSFTFNNWRYIYESRDIALNSEDKYAAQTKESLKAENINVTGSNTIEYTYTQGSFKAVIYLTKVNNDIKEILDRTIYVTPVDMAKDPHSAEGYYEMTWFYGNPSTVNESSINPVRYQPLFSGTSADRPQSSAININYLDNNQKCWGISCLGGNGPDGSVTNYKGAFAVKVDGSNETAQISSIMKVQMQGHNDFNTTTKRKYIHGTFDSLAISQTQPHSGQIVDKSLFVKLVSNSGDEGSQGAYLAYTFLQDNVMQFETQFWSTYQFMYKAKKVSDRYLDLPVDKYAGDDVSDRNPPEVPDLAKVVPVEDFTGSITPIE